MAKTMGLSGLEGGRRPLHQTYRQSESMRSSHAGCYITRPKLRTVGL